MADIRQQLVYEIKVQGELDMGWEGWLSGLTVTVEPAGDGAPVTTLRGPVADQAALRGLLSRLWDLNLALLSVHCCPAGDKEEERDV